VRSAVVIGGGTGRPGGRWPARQGRTAGYPPRSGALSWRQEPPPHAGRSTRRHRSGVPYLPRYLGGVPTPLGWTRGPREGRTDSRSRPHTTAGDRHLSLSGRRLLFAGREGSPMARALAALRRAARGVRAGRYALAQLRLEGHAHKARLEADCGPGQTHGQGLPR